MDDERKYDPVTSEAKKDIRPGFLSGLRNDDKASRKAEESKTAKDNLKSVEDTAGDKAPEQAKDGLINTKTKEEEAGGLYTGVGKNNTKKKKGRFAGRFKKSGPIVSIFSVILLVGGLMGGTQLFQPFSLLAQFMETYNTMHIATKTRAGTFIRLQLGDNVVDPVKGSKIFGKQHFKISNKQATKLAAQGIEYDPDGADGKGILRFKTDTDTIEVTAKNFKSVYDSNPDFNVAYNKGSMTWRGQIANWFESVTNRFLKNNILTRNLFKNFREDADASGDSMDTTIKTIAKRTETLDDGGVKNTNPDEGFDDNSDVKVKYDDDGNLVDIQEDIKIDYKALNNDEIVPADTENYKFKILQTLKTPSNKGYKEGVNNMEGRGKINRSGGMTTDAVTTKLNKINGTISKGANMACAGMNFLGAVTLLVAANEALQVINLTTSYFEAIDKVKAGDGSSSPINDLANALNNKKTNEHEDLNIDGESSNKTSSTKTAMESEGITALYGGGAINPRDPSVQSFNFSSNLHGLLGSGKMNSLGISMATFNGCAVTKLAANAIQAVPGIIDAAGCILAVAGAAFTFGLSTVGCGPFLANLGFKIFVSVTAAVLISTIIGIITPVIANRLTRDLVTNLGGEDLGNALMSGSNMYQGNNHRANGGSLSTINKYKEFALAQKQVIAEDAEYERQTRNPFDVTSKYTFMGTLFTQMMGFLSVSSLMSIMTSTSSVISSSVVAMSPTANALDIADDLPSSMEEYEETCPYLASIGAIGDAYCNPYAVTDLSTIEEEPAEIINKLDAMGSFLSTEDKYGNVQIDKNSDLAKYILYCDNRTSAFGIADNNIVSGLSADLAKTGSSEFNMVTNAAIGAIPGLGDTIDVISNARALENAGYISGESCVATDGETSFKGTNWETAKYYQRFIEDQSLAETMGLIGEDGNGKSAVSVFLDEYYEENPLDNSYEGILARYSGLEKDTVVAVLDLVDYGNYIANYHPEERYAFGAPLIESEKELKFDNENELANVYFLLLNEISFADVRNRSFAV